MGIREELPVFPRHVGIIMDGNGRWAKKRGLPRSAGHVAGAKVFKKMALYAADIGLPCLTVYAFSTENWNRSPEEVGALMGLILEFFTSEIDELDAKNVRILILGDKSRLPQKQREVLYEAEERTGKNTGLHLNIAINYGGRAELTLAAKEIAQLVQRGEMQPENITERTLSDHLYTRGQPDVDLLIRTSGEMRLSNFLLYQCAYAEFLFPTTLWPDFSVHDYDLALQAYGGRERRFGKRLS